MVKSLDHDTPTGSIWCESLVTSMLTQCNYNPFQASDLIDGVQQKKFSLIHCQLGGGEVATCISKDLNSSLNFETRFHSS